MIDRLHYTPSHIANFFLGKEDHDISNLKLNKLVYISVGFSLAILDKDLFKEDIEAWRYGPVIPSLYHEFKGYGATIIRVFSKQKGKDYPKIEAKEDKDVIDVLGIVWQYYKGKSGLNLIHLTHEVGTPWDIAFKPNKNNIISREAMKTYYSVLFDD